MIVELEPLGTGDNVRLARNVDIHCLGHRGNVHMLARPEIVSKLERRRTSEVGMVVLHRHAGHGVGRGDPGA